MIRFHLDQNQCQLFWASKFVLFLSFQRVKKMRYFLDFPHRVVHKNNGQVTSLTIIILPESRNVKMSLKNDQKINELQKWAPKKKLQVALLNADWLCHCNLEEELTDDKATKKLWLDHCLWVFLCFRGNYKIKNSGNITKTRKRVKKANKTESISQNESSKHFTYIAILLEFSQATDSLNQVSILLSKTFFSPTNFHIKQAHKNSCIFLYNYCCDWRKSY